MPPKLHSELKRFVIGSRPGSLTIQRNAILLFNSTINQGVYVPRKHFGIRSLKPHRPNRFNAGRGLPVLQSSPAAALERKIAADTLPLRSGALAVKRGMTGIYDTETGSRIPCTILQLDRVQVISHRTVKQHGYFAVQVGSGWKHHRRMNKALLGHFSANGVAPKRYVHEFRVRDESGLLAIGEEIKADWFREGQFVDTRSNTHGKGFAGVMKRHGFHGQDRSHGVSLTHRSMGSAGPSQGGGSRVYPGKKMAGRMGNVRNTVQNLEVLKVDSENSLVLVKGAVSGPKNCVVIIQDAIKKPWPKVSGPVTVETTTEHVTA